MNASEPIAGDQAGELQGVRDELEAARRRVSDLEDSVKSSEEENSQLKSRDWDLSQQISDLIHEDKQNYILYQKVLREKTKLQERAEDLDAQVKYWRKVLDNVTAECLELRRATGASRGPGHRDPEGHWPGPRR